MDEDVEMIAPEYESTLLNAFVLTNRESGDRASAYGPFWEDYRRVASIFCAITDDQPVIMNAELGILWMVAVKLGRISHALCTGAAYENPESVKDSITDACGYLDGLWATLNNPEFDDLIEEEDEDDE